MTENALSTDVRGSQLNRYLRSPEIMARFAELMGNRQAAGYISSVLIAVAQSSALSECSPRSIATSAMRAATLKLSCDPSTKQAHLVPFKGKATLIVGYKGLYDMALRTNKYRYLNDFPVYEGQRVVENQLTGEIRIDGQRTGQKVIGYGLYFKLSNGFEKVYYMTVEEIHAHAKQYSKTYGRSDSPWTTDFDKMARKTVIRLGLGKYGYLDPLDVMALEQSEEAEGEDGSLPGPDQVTMPPEAAPKSEAQLMGELGYPEPAVTEGVFREAESPAGEPGAQPAAEQPVAEKPALRYGPEQLRAHIAEVANGAKGQASNGKRGLVATTLETALSNTTDPGASRHQVLKYLTGHASIRDIPDSVILALYAWLKPAQDSGGAWMADEMSAREAVAVLNAAQPAQEELFK